MIKDFVVILLYYYTCVVFAKHRNPPSWSIRVSIAAQKFATCITDWKGSDTTWELRMRNPQSNVIILVQINIDYID